MPKYTRTGLNVSDNGSSGVMEMKIWRTGERYNSEFVLPNYQLVIILRDLCMLTVLLLHLNNCWSTTEVKLYGI